MRETPTASAIVFSVTRFPTLPFYLIGGGSRHPPVSPRYSPAPVNARRAVRDEDPQVEPQRGVLDVPEVELDPLVPRQRGAAVDLRPAGDPGQRVEPAPLALVVAVDLDLHGRARADERHLAAQHVDEVRHLVERRAAQPRAEPRDAVVALVDGQALAHVLGAADHRAQLVELERPRRRGRRAAGGRPDGRASRAGSRSPRRRAPGVASSSAPPPTTQVERPLAARAQVARAPHRVPSGVSQPTSAPWRSQSYRPAASAAVVST